MLLMILMFDVKTFFDKVRIYKFNLQYLTYCWCFFRWGDVTISPTVVILVWRSVSLNQQHPQIPISLVINIQHCSNSSICQDWPNCLGLASNLCSSGSQICGTPCLLHSCLPSWAQVSEAPIGPDQSASLHWELMFTTPHHHLPVG